MIVVFEMAIYAGAGSVRELLRFVTIVTVSICVLAQQWKCGQVVIEKRCVRPFFFGVTTTTKLT